MCLKILVMELKNYYIVSLQITFIHTIISNIITNLHYIRMISFMLYLNKLVVSLFNSYLYIKTKVAWAQFQMNKSTQI